MTGRAAEINQTSFGQHDDGTPRFQRPFVHLWFDNFFLADFACFQVVHINFTVKMSNITHNGFIFHHFHVLTGNDIATTRRRHKNIAYRSYFLHGS